MMAKNPIQILIFIIGLVPMTSCWADIKVKLAAPNWEFLLQNQPWAASQAQLASGESHFARTIQPMLAAQDHQGILQAFKTRDMANDSAALKLLRGQVLLSLKQYPQAERALLAALETMPDLALAHRSLSLVYMFDKQYNKAQKHLSRSIELGVADAQVYGQLAFVNLQLGQAASAVAGYQYALFLDVNNAQWRQGLLFALIQSQAFDQAQALIEELIQTEPGNRDLWLQRGQLALKQQRNVQAIASMETALQLGINDAENIAMTAQLHIQNGSPRRAVELLVKHLDTLLKSDKVDVIGQIADWLAFEQAWPKLTQLMKSVSQSKVKLAAGYRSRFSVYQAQIDLSEPKLSDQNRQSAKKHLNQALKADPANGEALLTLAKLLREQHLNEQAVMYYSRATALPNFKERALLGRTQLEIDRRNYNEALRLLRIVLQDNPKRNDVLANIQSLESLLRSQG